MGSRGTGTAYEKELRSVCFVFFSSLGDILLCWIWTSLPFKSFANFEACSWAVLSTLVLANEEIIS